jgi:hypothetical protein
MLIFDSVKFFFIRGRLIESRSDCINEDISSTSNESKKIIITSSLTVDVIVIINSWERIADSPSVFKSIKRLCELLIIQVRKRFDYEINSDIYKVFVRILFIITNLNIAF